MNERELIYETKYDYDVRGNCIAEDQYSTLIPNIKKLDGKGLSLMK